MATWHVAMPMSNDFHAGLYEVFYIGDNRYPRCGVKDKAEIFAGEITKIGNHLALNEVELWI